MDLISAIIAVGTVTLIAWYFFSGPKNLPPGPRSLPIVGNILHFGARHHLDFSELAEKYGDVFKLYYGSRLVVVLNGYRVIHECLVLKSSIFANRPALYINNTVTGINGISQLRVGKGMRDQRKFVYNCLREVGRVGKIDLERKIFEEIEVLFRVLEELKGCPFEPHSVISKAVANTLSNILFGARFEYDDPRFLKLLGTVPGDASITLTADMLQYVPKLRFFPRFRKMLNAVFKMADNFIGVVRDIIVEHKTRFSPENEVSDIIDAFLLEIHKAEKNGEIDSSFSHKQMEWFVGDLFIGGTANPTQALVWLLALLVAHPHVYERVQAEIDDVIGTARPPRLSDRVNMPYTEATLLEQLRYSSPAPMAIPHSTTEEVEVDGYTIPANTMVFVNLWSVNRDPKTWSYPDRFYPEHFLDNTGKVRRPESFIPFGGGARVCPGEAFAKLEIFLFLTTLLQRFHFRLPEGAAKLDTRIDAVSHYVRKPRDLVAAKRT